MAVAAEMRSAGCGPEPLPARLVERAEPGPPCVDERSDGIAAAAAATALTGWLGWAWQGTRPGPGDWQAYSRGEHVPRARG